MADNRRDPHAPSGDPALLRAFLDEAVLVAFVEDELARLVYTNPKAQSLFGREGWDRVTGSGASPAARERGSQILETHRQVERIDAVSEADGAVEHWMVVRFPIAMPDGRQFLGGLGMDVSRLEHARTQLADSEQRYRHLVESAQGLICTHDMDGRLLTVNQAALTATGMTAEEVLGQRLGDLLCDVSREQFPGYLRRMHEIGTDAGLMFVRTRTGRELAWQYRNVKVSEPGRAPYVLGHAQDVTELRNAQEQLRELAMTDELTGLQNRRGFFSNGGRVLAEAVRHGKPVTVVYADIDGLKHVNDTAGHDAGTSLIAAAADVLKNTFRAADIVARLGGDEFVAVAAMSRADALTIASRLAWHQEKFNAGAGLPYRLSMSVGMAHVDAGASADATLELLVKEADAAMYRQKRGVRS